MARRVQPEDIKKINEVYALCGNYTKTAEATGWSASTVKKYIQADFKLEKTVISTDARPVIKDVNVVIEELKEGKFLTQLTASEKAEIKQIQKGLII